MPRQYQPLEIKSFAQGLITEANPLKFPQNASIDEVNFEIQNDKSRKRRLGIDIALGSSWKTTGQSPDNKFFNSILWKNAGGVSYRSILVIQVGNELFFYDTDADDITQSLIHETEVGSGGEDEFFDMSVVDSFLVVATGNSSFYIFEYDAGTIVQKTESLRIRDTFGLEDYYNGVNYREGSGLTRRPSTLTSNHLYNLKNQTWGLPRIDSGLNKLDPLTIFNGNLSTFPSNADNFFDAYYEDISSDEPQTKKYFARDVKAGPLGSYPAPKGFFIIDALDRGASREEAYRDLIDSDPVLTRSIGTLNKDRTEGGATCVAQYGGRIWFGGFSGETVEPDEYSPDMSSYLLYSQLVQSKKDINKCYQEGDPTGYEAPDLVDTDGGFIRIDGAYDIKRIFDIGRGLLVIAINGVWMVSGGSDYGFSATNNKVLKLTERGTVNAASCVVLENTVLYWGEDGIYHIRPNQYGDYEANNITEKSIQTFYDSISSTSKLYCQGRYDSYDRKVRWLYNNTMEDRSNTEELSLDVSAGAFVRGSISYSEDLPLKVPSSVEVPPYVSTSSQQEITYNSQEVVYNGEQVTANLLTFSSSIRQVKYLVFRIRDGLLEFNLCSPSNSSFRDWENYNGTGIDAEAYMITGWVSGGDNIRMKQTPYLIMHMERTETGFYEDANNDLQPLNPSSCIVRPQWEWTNSPASGKWGRPFQVYRYKRPYFATGTQDNYDTGDKLIVTKNKLRGRGRVVSLDIRTEPGKDCHIYGWGMIMGANGNV